MTETIFLEVSALMGITITLALLMRLLKQPLVIAYILAGMVAGPLFLNILSGHDLPLQSFAQFGIVLLLFIVGLSLNVASIKQVGRAVFIGSIIQFLATVFFGYWCLVALGLSSQTALFLSVAVAFSSTIIVVKLLTDKKDTESVYGRFVIGILLVQDIIAILIMVFLNTVQANTGSLALTMFITLSKGIVLTGVVLLLARFILPVIIDKVAQSGELLFVFTLAWCFGVASIVKAAGFTVEIGAIIAGIALAASPYQPMIASRMRPLRDFFIVIFFITLGSEMRLGQFQEALMPAAILTLFVLIIDPIILYGVMRTLKYTRRNAFLASITAAQVSEFGFIFLFTAESMGFVDGAALAILTLVALVTIMISSYLISYNESVYRRLRPLFELFGKDASVQKVEGQKRYQVWVFGYHRIGWKVCEALLARKISFAVVDFNPDVIAKLSARGIPVFFGDASDVEFLESIPLLDSRMIISTLPSMEDQKTLLSYVRKSESKARVILNAYHSSQVPDFYRAGADYVMMPHLLGGTWIADVLEHKPWSERTFKSLRAEQQDDLHLRFAYQIRE